MERHARVNLGGTEMADNDLSAAAFACHVRVHVPPTRAHVHMHARTRTQRHAYRRIIIIIARKDMLIAE